MTSRLVEEFLLLTTNIKSDQENDMASIQPCLLSKSACPYGVVLYPRPWCCAVSQTSKTNPLGLVGWVQVGLVSTVLGTAAQHCIQCISCSILHEAGMHQLGDVSSLHIFWGMLADGNKPYSDTVHFPCAVDGARQLSASSRAFMQYKSSIVPVSAAAGCLDCFAVASHPLSMSVQ